MAEAVSNVDATDSSPAKKIKLSTEETAKDDDSIHETKLCLSTFEMTRILNNNCTRKQICIEGTFKGRESPAIVLLEKKNFTEEESFLKKGYFNEDTSLRKLFRNDIYGNYEIFPIKEYNGLNATVIHPATPKHIEKFKRKELYIIDETSELYKKITLPHIESKSFSLQWIDNILEHKAETENIVYEDRDKDNGFVMVNDLKWDGNPGTLKLIALPFKRVRSIRELDGSHLPLLKNIRDAGTSVIAKKFNIPVSQLRIYLHYQPSYYYLHVHFAYLMFETPGVYVEKAHLLSMVIKNLELMPDYYAKAVLSYVVAEGDPLFNKFQQHGILGETKSIPSEV